MTDLDLRALSEAEVDAPEEAAQFLGMRRTWWLDGARWAMNRWRAALTRPVSEAPDIEPMKDDNDYVWLIEQGQPEGYTPPIYYAFDQEKRGHRYPAWTTDPYKASPFRSRDLALAFMASHRDGDRPMPGRPVEHGFIPPRPADASGVGEGLDVVRLSQAFLRVNTFMDGIAASQAAGEIAAAYADLDPANYRPGPALLNPDSADSLPPAPTPASEEPS